MKIQITKKQKQFLDATADEVLYGGAAGGGKSYGQVVDAFIFALKYPGSKQIIFRRTYKELEKSILRTVQELYPTEIFRYKDAKHTGVFVNGSILDFGYIDNEKDVFNYQSAEYDVIRFDELTHFSETMYIYLLSRVRGANDFPKQMKSSTNPGNIGHQWVKKRFIDIGEPNKVHEIICEDKDGEKEITTRIFIPAKVQENKFLMAKDPGYIKKLKMQDEKNKKALLYGEWDIFDGQYFGEFKREKHVIEPFKVPSDWRMYRAFDYGLDRLAVLWFAVNSLGEVFVIREYSAPNVIISDACKTIKELTNENIYLTYAPPDMWARSQESGKCKADLFYEGGLKITKSNNNREAGWLCVKELLRDTASGEPRLKIFSNCLELIRCLPALQYDTKNPTDCAKEPHDITHITDALRYFAVQHVQAADIKEKPRAQDFEFQKVKDDYGINTEITDDYINF